VSTSLQSSIVETIREGIPFLAITVFWIVVMSVVYGVFLVTKPTNIDYDAWVHATVFLVPGIGFLGHVLQQALRK
jgi:hypothetical protein